MLVHNADCGGRYADLKKTSDSSTEQVHHMPADSSSPLSKSDGVAIKMDISDHKQTASFDRKPGSDAYRKTQAKLIKDGNFNVHLIWMFWIYRKNFQESMIKILAKHKNILICYLRRERLNDRTFKVHTL